MDILFELANGLGAEGVRDGLALTSVFDTVAGIEETTTDGDKGIIKVTREEYISILL